MKKGWLFKPEEIVVIWMKKIVKRAAVLALAMSLAIPSNAIADTWKGSGNSKYYVENGKKASGFRTDILWIYFRETCMFRII